MKQKIFMYLFIFSLLILIFQFANSKRILDSYETDINQLKTQLKERDSIIKTLETETLQLNEFSINGNEDALSYFQNQGFNSETLIPQILDGLYSMNNFEGDDHPIVPYASMTENKIAINNVKVLNHKWMIANFTDGTYWGEILIAYEVETSGDVTYKLVEYLLYPTY